MTSSAPTVAVHLMEPRPCSTCISPASRRTSPHIVAQALCTSFSCGEISRQFDNTFMDHLSVFNCLFMIARHFPLFPALTKRSLLLTIAGAFARLRRTTGAEVSDLAAEATLAKREARRKTRKAQHFRPRGIGHRSSIGQAYCKKT